MPAKTEKQRRFMAMCAHSGESVVKAKCPDMSREKMREFSTMDSRKKKKRSY